MNSDYIKSKCTLVVNLALILAQFRLYKLPKPGPLNLLSQPLHRIFAI